MKQQDGNDGETRPGGGTAARPEKLIYCVPVADDVSRIISRVEANQIVAKTSAPDSVRIGENLRRVKGGIESTARGNLKLIDEVLTVGPLLELAESPAESLEFNGDVSMKGPIEDGARLRIAGSLVVSGRLGAADVSAGAWLEVKGGIQGKGSAEIFAGRGASCRFISGARLICAGDLAVQGEIQQSDITCGGKLSAAVGPIAGGTVSTFGGLVCPVLGSAGEVTTIVEVGIAALERVAAETSRRLEESRSRARVIRDKVSPLTRNESALTSQQRERMTAALSEADTLEAGARLLEAILARLNAIDRNVPRRLSVSDMVQPGVVLRIAGNQSIISKAIKGPIVVAAHEETGHRAENQRRVA